MALVKADRVKESTGTTGTSDFALGGAASGYRTFSSVMASGDTCYYTAIDRVTNAWECGLGTFTSPSTLARTTVQSSSTGSKISFAVGSKDILMSVTAGMLDTGLLPTITTGGLVVAVNPLGTDYQLRQANLADASSAMVPATATSINILGVTACRRLTFSQGTPFVNLTELISDDLVTITNYSTSQSLWIRNFPALQTVSLRALMFCQAVTFLSNPSLTSIEIPSLMKTSNFSISNCASLTEIRYEFLSEVGGAFQVIGCPMLQGSFLFPSRLKVIGGNVDLSNNALPNADHWLVALVNLDGNNGKCLWGAGLTCNLSGGTNAAPTAAGLTAKAILVARGCTVTHN